MVNLLLNNMKSKHLIIFFILLLVFLTPIVSAKDYILDFDSELIDGNGKYIDTSNAVSIESHLVLHVTLSNPNDFWIDLGSISWNIGASQNSREFEKITSSESMTNVLIPAKEKIDIYIILDGYNSLDNDERIGVWEIDFEGNINEVEYYYSNNLDKITYPTSSQIKLNPSKANLIKFEVQKESSQLDKSFDFGRGISKINELDPIFKLIGLFVALGTFYLLYKKK